MGDVNIYAPLIKDELTDQDAFTSHTVGAAIWNSSKTNSTPPTSTEQIIQVCDEIKAMLLEKNRKYGDSALNPTRIFSKADAVEQIKVRIDDKLTRMKNQQDDEDEDVVSDLIGYLVLLKIAKRQTIPEAIPLDGDDFVDWDKIFPKEPVDSPWIPTHPAPDPYTPSLPWQQPTITWDSTKYGNSQAS